MRQQDLPENWKQKLKSFLAEKGQPNEYNLGASDFTEDIVRIIYEDDSKVEFRYAFLINAPEMKEVGVFTEHCGHHIFPLYDGLDITIESNRDDSASSV